MSGIELVLTAFSSDFTLSDPALIGVQDVSMNPYAATIDLSFQVPRSTIRNTFYIQTDNDITMDASFVYYYVDAAAWPTSQDNLNPKNGTINGYNGGGYVVGDGVSKDFIRNLAHQLFGTYLGADLFTNEDVLVADINASCNTVAEAIQTKLNSVDKTLGNFAGIVSGANGKYLPDVTSTGNLTRELFKQMMFEAAPRFADISGTDMAYTAKGAGFYHLPFINGDTISFNLVINPKSDQHTFIATKGVPLDPRSYRVKLSVGA